MTSKVLSVLIVGGTNSAETYLGHPSACSGSSGYVSQLARQLKRAGWQVHIESHTPIDIHMALPLIRQINLNRFDLILFELGHTQLQEPAVFGDLFRASAPATHHNQRWVNSKPTGRLLSQAKLTTLRLLNLIGRVGRLQQLETQLTDLLYYVQAHRRRLVLITPLTHPQQVSNWIRQEGRQLFKKYGRHYMIPVFDTATVIGQGDEFFTDFGHGQLSLVAGDLLGQMLFDYIQTNALLPARPELRQRRQ